jgi:hypothetical protein
MRDKERLQEKIRKKGADWKADETSMSGLTDEEIRARLGLLPTEDEKKTIEKKCDDKSTSST